VPSTGRVAAIAALLLAVFGGLLLAGWGNGLVTGAVVVTATAVAAVVTAAVARRDAGVAITPWLALTVGLVAATVAQWLWFFAAQHDPARWIAAVAYLVFAVCIMTALLVLPARPRRPWWSLTLDGLIVAGSLLIVCWLTVLTSAGSATSTKQLAAMGYPILNAVILAVAVVALSRAAQGRVVGFFTVALAGIALGQYAAAVFSIDRLTEVGWIAGMLVIVVAVIDSRRDRSDHTDTTARRGWVSTLLPYAALLLALAVAVTARTNPFGSRFVVTVGGVLVGAVLVHQVVLVAENRRLFMTVNDEATRDPLTGKANRAAFLDRLRRALRKAQRDGESVGVIELDLHDFKLINDTMGFGAGDELLINSAGRISECVGHGDTVARLGGDKFAVIIDGGLDRCEAIARRMVAAFDLPFVINGYELLIRPSVGIAVAEPAGTAEQLLKHAGIAVKSAKSSDAGGIRTFTADMSAGEVDNVLPKPSHARGGGPEVAQLLGELRRAIDQSELILVYQPKFDAQTRAVVGVEALVRWPHPDRGLLSPDEFLPLVRRHRLMGGTTDFVLGRALDDAARCQAVGLHVPVAVNLFAPLLGNLNLPTKIDEALTRRGLPASALTVEITEDLFVDDMERTQRVLHDLSECGIKIAIDDFGTGYSALSYLTDLPVDEVKLDRGFVARTAEDERAAMVVRVIVDLAHRLDLVTVAEGIDSADLAARLTELGCDTLQGYHLSPPLSVDQLIDMLTTSATAATSLKP
jgi:diguanylate cyclase (GGDEF)-like protein